MVQNAGLCEFFSSPHVLEWGACLSLCKTVNLYCVQVFSLAIEKPWYTTSVEFFYHWFIISHLSCMSLEFFWPIVSRKECVAPNVCGVCVLQVPLSTSMSPMRLHASNPNLCAELVDYQTPVSRLTDGIECASDYIKLQEDFCMIAQKGRVYSNSPKLVAPS